MKPFYCQEARMTETHNNGNSRKKKLFNSKSYFRTNGAKQNKANNIKTAQELKWNEQLNWMYASRKKDEMPIVTIAFRLISSGFLPWTSSFIVRRQFCRLLHSTYLYCQVCLCFHQQTLLFGMWSVQTTVTATVFYSCCLNSVSICLLHCLPMVQCRST